MCGIAGFVSARHSRESGSDLLDRMLAAQNHRGPDHTGAFIAPPFYLGHNRLSIIDLSEAANQPMTADGVTIIFNGEVYNHPEIRTELRQLGHGFHTASDTEVILQAYRQWGADCVTRFIGMWALAIYDENEKHLFCSRDRFGIKPFNYIHRDGDFYFASELKTLRLTPPFSKALNLAQVSRGLQLGWLCWRDETCFERVMVLPPAHNLILRNGSVRIRRYWDIDPGKGREGKSFEERREIFASLFHESVRIHQRSDVPFGAALSGGIDSSAIVSAVCRGGTSGTLETFTAYYEGSDAADERPFVNEVAAKYRTQVQSHTCSPGDTQIAGDFARILHHCDLPATGSSFVSQYYVMKSIAARGLKVVLSGQGADDYLGGYLHSFYRLFADNLHHGFGRFLAALLQYRKYWRCSPGKTLDVAAKSLLAALFSEEFLCRLEYRRYYPLLIPSARRERFELAQRGTTRLDRFLYQLMFETSLPTLLHYEDRNSMAFSIESRVPFLDHRLVEFAFSLPDEDKIRDCVTKHILREAVKEILPAGICRRRDKRAFETPGETVWLRGSLRFLLEDRFEALSFIDRRRWFAALERYKAGDNENARLVWRTAVLNHWMKTL